MSCVVMSEYSEGKIGKGDFKLNDAMNGTADYLSRVLSQKRLDNRFKIIHPSKMEMCEVFLYREMRNTSFLRKFGFSYDCIEDLTYADNYVKPDGGIIWLVDNKTHQRYPLIASEMKYQGTNKRRQAVGLSKQASGNANERVGKYARLFEALWEFDDIMPFVTFHSGCDYHISEKNSQPLDNGARTQMAKLLCMNAFHPVNKVFTSQNMPKTRRQLPSTVMVKEDFWTIEEMRKVTDKVGLDSLKYYLNIIKEDERK
jgi:hypothetical protein